MTGYVLTTGRTFKLMAINPGGRIGCEHTLGSDCRTPPQGRREPFRGCHAGRFVLATEPAPAWRGAHGDARRDGRACALPSSATAALRLAEQTAGAALLEAPSLVVGHGLKLSADAVPQARPRVWFEIATFNPAEMQASGGYSNQDSGAIDKVVSELLAALASQEARSGLSRLAEKLAGLRASDAQPRAITSRRLRPRRPGWVLEAVRDVMVDHTGPMRVAHVHAAVEAALGESVSANSVSWMLASHSAGLSPLFVRVARGRYVVANTRSKSASRRLTRGD